MAPATRGSPLERIAIVDDDPAAQYLYPEFQLFERMFKRFGVEAFVADARKMEWKRTGCARRGAGGPCLQSTDGFYLQEPAHAALRAAYEAKAVVVTPTPARMLSTPTNVTSLR